ncbi:ABC transporter permease [Leptothoe sp. PORK10 BA2]|uniref:ABC transporter permease n=1 Tax=Leptothoe sp. PORK10 BA2 TaxID=3110254 RepID=UPI002B1EF090|nr:ABC transporter permease [Leptothoe sp. PORK10 BA2]MEA5462708.1 ABC transporter permease [Leptothoe sp. PORK10 BA2]
MKALMSAIWQYRYFILSSIKVDFRSRFVRSRLGGLWMIIHPLVQAAIFALVLGQLLSGRLPDMADNKLAYAIYLLAGTLAWNLFTEVITRCLTVFIDNGNLLKKLAFPKICLPLIVTGSAIVNNAFLFGAILTVCAVMGYVPGGRVFWIPILTIITLGLALGIGLILGTLNVFIRDIGQIVPIALQLSFWFTPIVYTPDIVPASLRSLIKFNPMYWIVGAYQSAILYGTDLEWGPLLCIFIISLLLLRVSMDLFSRARHEIVDVL